MDGGVRTHALCLRWAAVVGVTCGNWRPLVWPGLGLLLLLGQGWFCLIKNWVGWDRSSSSTCFNGSIMVLSCCAVWLKASCRQVSGLISQVLNTLAPIRLVYLLGYGCWDVVFLCQPDVNIDPHCWKRPSQTQQLILQLGAWLNRPYLTGSRPNYFHELSLIKHN